MVTLPATVPGKIESPPTFVLTSTTCVITWTAPETTGGSNIIGYVIQKRMTPRTSLTQVLDSIFQYWINNTDTTSLTYTATGLDVGFAYAFRVGSINSIGTSLFTESSATTSVASTRPTQMLLPPTISLSTPTKVVLEWTAPLLEDGSSGDGGSNILGYRIYQRQGGIGTFSTLISNTNLNTWTFTIVSTSLNQNINIQPVEIKQIVGDTESSTEAIGLLKYSLTGDTTSLVVSADPSYTFVTTADLILQAEGQTPITVPHSSLTSVTNAISSIVTNYTVNNLLANEIYEFKISAINSAGVGNPSLSSGDANSFVAADMRLLGTETAATFDAAKQTAFLTALSETIQIPTSKIFLLHSFTLTITTQVIDEQDGVTVRQGSGSDAVSGILKTTLTGATTSVVLLTASGVTWVASKDVEIGSTTVPLLTITSATDNGVAINIDDGNRRRLGK